MKGEKAKECSKLLELAAIDDVNGFICEVEEKNVDIDEVSYWYGSKIGSRKMGFEERTPFMIACLYGSIKVAEYILASGKVDVNRACGLDGATALHCAVAGASDLSLQVINLLIQASADIHCVDAYGNKPSDLISYLFLKSKRKTLEMMLLNGDEVTIDEEAPVKEKKEYPVDVSLPDINTGLYGTDEFRMFSFKVKPCSRAYSHDWTECPFVHPGENARRRDPNKYLYSCVPCPEFKKGNCGKGDNCEYAHGVFESWLHPAQYRTRLCKDETGCSRKVCFFAHKVEELRPLYASTGSGMPSPKSTCSMDMIGTTSSPPMSPVITAACSSPMSMNMWQHLTPPALQLPGSRLKTASNARDVDLEHQQRQQLIDEMTSHSSPSRWNNLRPTNLEDVFGSLDPSLISQLQGLSQSPTTGSRQMRQNTNHLRASYPSPVRKAFDSSAAVATAVMNSRSAAFAKRSQSFVERTSPINHNHIHHHNHHSHNNSLNSDWNSPDGRLEWGFNNGAEDHNKLLQKSASFGFRNGNNNMNMEEPDVSWVHSLVKDVPPSSKATGLYNSSEQKKNGAGAWFDHQMYMIEQEKIYA